MATSNNDMNRDNDNRTLITAIAVLVALAAVTYALVTKSNTATVSSVTVSEQSYEVSENNPVVLEYEGRKVTRQEIINNFEASNSKLPAGTDLQQIFPLLQDQYIIGELLEDAARDEGITDQSPEVVDQLRQARELALRAAYIKKIGEEAVSEDELRQAYEDIVAAAPDTEERHARHILVQSESEAREIINQLNGGADFVELAKSESEAPEGENGGDLGYFSKDEMVAPFAEAAFALSEGEISKTPVQTNFGWHVIKVEDIRTRAKPAFEEVRDQLAQQLRQGVVASKLQELREGADITVYSYAGEPVEAATEEETAVPAPAPVTDAPTTTEDESAADAETTPVPAPAPVPAPVETTEEEPTQE